MGNRPEDRRDKWKALMKESLHQAVVKILAEDGLRGLTMDRVSQMAGMAKGTLYTYFKDKQELMQYVVQASLEPLEKKNTKLFASDLPPERKLEGFVLQSLSYFEEHRNFFRILLDPELSGPRMHKGGKDRHRKLIQQVSVVFEEGIRAGGFRRLPPLKLAAMFVMSCMAMNMGRMWMEERGPIEAEARLVIEVFFRGIATGDNL